MFDGNEQAHNLMPPGGLDLDQMGGRVVVPPAVQGDMRNAHPVTAARINPIHIIIGARVFRSASVAITLQDEQFGKFAGLENRDLVVLLSSGRAVYLSFDTIVGYSANWPHSWDGPMLVINPTDAELANAGDASESPLLAAIATSSFSEGES